MKKICFFIGNLDQAGGTERVSSVIANAIGQKGYEIHMLSLQCGQIPFFKLDTNIKYSQLFKNPGRGIIRLPVAIRKLRAYLKKNHIDVLIDVESMLALYAIPAIVGMNIRHICWEHFNYNVDLGKATRSWARKLAARFADDVVTLTEADKKLWQDNTTCNANITTIPNPITIEISTDIKIKKEKLLLAIGRLEHEKGFDLLLEAWSKISTRHPDWRLRIVGSGQEHTSLEKIRNELKIQESTELVPTTKNIAEHYNQATFFVVSSRFEGFGLVIIEALAFGIPVISFDCPFGPKEIIKEGKHGWLCSNGNTDHLSDRIDQELKSTEKNPDRYNNISENCKLRSKEFSIDHISRSWIELLEK
ncbi:glycosyltransferase family 4 protein [Craterilacuibacter sp. RT1T]|uniref:glycosyltransferase family 4 protein n=1 Tax=Craterilacuibacter sp. RT1T TaxID=2942211 RepID=UPI0020C065FB|nr:glycosyltransferase family 4 protein [Craterilacuibacter sp. RT1T]MCL6263663.1 glycosyltransferase family 4 protein [Craterilacuibacter sp. RT1T]